ncbi:hypothetical protein ACWGHM_14765 [Streptomyces sp. NPDC054904]|uniref:hypothetical protein n=1 Tax=Streptomyces sp. NPDC090054 TaxID=3365933 RepID=UPI0037FD6E9C
MSMHAQARPALLSGAAALIVLLVFAGLRSVVLVEAVSAMTRLPSQDRRRRA